MVTYRMGSTKWLFALAMITLVAASASHQKREVITAASAIQATLDADAACKSATSTLGSVQFSALFTSDSTFQSLSQQVTTALASVYAKVVIASSELLKVSAQISGSLKTEVDTCKSNLDDAAQKLQNSLSSLLNIATAAAFKTALGAIVSTTNTVSSTLTATASQLSGLKTPLQSALDTVGGLNFDLSDLTAVLQISVSINLNVIINLAQQISANLQALLQALASVSSALQTATAATYPTLKSQLTTALNNLLSNIESLITELKAAILQSEVNVQLKAFLSAALAACQGISLQLNAFVTIVQTTASPATLKLVLDGLSASLTASIKSSVEVVANAIAQLNSTATSIGSAAVIQATTEAAAALQAAIATCASIKTQASSATDATVPALISQTVTLFTDIYIKLGIASSKLSELIATVPASIKTQLQPIKSAIDNISANINAIITAVANVNTAAAFNHAIDNIANDIASLSSNCNGAKDQLISIKSQIEAALQAAVQIDLADVLTLASIQSSIDLTAVASAATNLQASLSSVSSILAAVTAALPPTNSVNLQGLRDQLVANLSDLLAKVVALLTAATNALANVGSNVQLEAFLTAVISSCEGLKVRITTFITLAQGAPNPFNLKIVLDGISANLYVTIKATITLVINAVIKLGGPVVATGSSAITQALVDAAAALQSSLADLTSLKSQVSTATDATVSALVQQAITLLIKIYVKLNAASAKLGEAIVCVTGTLKDKLQSIQSSINSFAADINNHLKALANVNTVAAFNSVITTILNSVTTISGNCNSARDQLLSLKAELEAALQVVLTINLSDLTIGNIQSSIDLSPVGTAAQNLQNSLATLASAISSVTAALPSATTANLSGIVSQLTAALNDLLAKVGALITAATNALGNVGGNAQLKAVLIAIISSCEGVKIQINGLLTLVQGQTNPANLQIILDNITVTLYVSIKATLAVVINAVLKLVGGLGTLGSSAIIQAVVDAAAALESAISAINTIKAQAGTATEATFNALLQQVTNLLSNVFIKLTFASSRLSEAIAKVTGTVKLDLQGIKAAIDGVSSYINSALAGLGTVTNPAALNLALTTLSSLLNAVFVSLNAAKDKLVNLQVPLDAALNAVLNFDLTNLLSITNVQPSIDVSALINAGQELRISLDDCVAIVSTVVESLPSATIATLVTIKIQLTAVFNDLQAKVDALLSTATSILANVGSNAQLKAFLIVVISGCEGAKVQISAFLALVATTVTPNNLKLLLDGLNISLYAAIKATLTLIVNAVLKLGGPVISIGSSAIIQPTIDAAAALQAAIASCGSIKDQVATATDATVGALAQQTLAILVKIYIRLTLASATLGEAIPSVAGSIKTQLQTFKSNIDNICASISAQVNTIPATITVAQFTALINTILNVITSASSNCNNVRDQMVNIKVQLDTALAALVQIDLSAVNIGSIQPSIDLSALANAAQNLQASLNEIANVIASLNAAIPSANPATVQGLRDELVTALNDLLAKVVALLTAATNALANVGGNVQLKAFLTAVIGACEGLKIKITGFITLAQGATSPANLQVILDGVSTSLYASLYAQLTLVINAVLKIGAPIINIGSSPIIQPTVDVAAALTLLVNTLTTIKAQASAATDATVIPLIQQTIAVLVEISAKLKIASSKLSEVIVKVDSPLKAQLQNIKASLDGFATTVNSLLANLANVNTAAAFNAAIAVILGNITTIASNCNSVKDQLLNLKLQLDAILQLVGQFDLLNLEAILNIHPTTDLTGLGDAVKLLETSLANLVSVIASVSAALPSATAAAFQGLKTQITSAVNDLLVKVTAVLTAATTALGDSGVSIQLRLFLTAVIGSCEGLRVQISGLLTLLQGATNPNNLKIILDGVSVNLIAAIKATITLVVNAVLKLVGPAVTIGSSVIIQPTIDAAAELQALLTALAAIKAQASTATDATVSALVQQTLSLLIKVYAKLILASSTLGEAIAFFTGSISAQLQSIKSSIDALIANVNSLITSLANVNTAAAFNAAITGIISNVTPIASNCNAIKDTLVNLKGQIDIALQAIIQLDLNNLPVIRDITTSVDLSALVSLANTLQVALSGLTTLIGTVTASLPAATAATFQGIKAQLASAFTNLLNIVNDLTNRATSLLANAGVEAQLRAFLTAIISKCQGIKVEINGILTLVQGAATPQALKIVLDGISVTLYSIVKVSITVIIKALAAIGGNISAVVGADVIVNAVQDASAAAQAALSSLAQLQQQVANAVTPDQISAVIKAILEIVINIYIKVTVSATALSETASLPNIDLQAQLQTVKSSIEGALVQLLASIYVVLSGGINVDLQATLDTCSGTVQSISTSLDSAHDLLLSLAAQIDAALDATPKFDLTDLATIAQITVSGIIAQILAVANSLAASLQITNSIATQVAASLGAATAETLPAIKVKLSVALKDLLTAVNAVIAAINLVLTKVPGGQLNALLHSLLNTCDGIVIQVNAAINLVGAVSTPESLQTAIVALKAGLFVSISAGINLVVNAIAKLQITGGATGGLLGSILNLLGFQCF